jgi:hypothetical protein
MAEATAYTEDCCFNEIREHCQGAGCPCRCHEQWPDQPSDERLAEIGREALGKIWARKTAEREGAAGGLLLLISQQERGGYLDSEAAGRARRLVARLLGYTDGAA